MEEEKEKKGERNEEKVSVNCSTGYITLATTLGGVLPRLTDGKLMHFAVLYLFPGECRHTTTECAVWRQKVWGDVSLFLLSPHPLLSARAEPRATAGGLLASSHPF